MKCAVDPVNDRMLGGKFKCCIVACLADFVSVHRAAYFADSAGHFLPLRLFIPPDRDWETN